MPLKNFLFLLLSFPIALLSRAEKNTIQGTVFEVSVETKKQYTNPFYDVEVNVVFKKGPQKWIVPAFWAGENIWTARFTPQDIGGYTYQVETSDPLNAEFNGIIKSFTVKPYHGSNQLIKHGFLKISDNKRHFEFTDGTPFFWLGDTWWKGLCKRISLDGFKKLANDRKEKGFSVIQIIAGPYPDEPPFDPRWANEGGMPYDANYAHINPVYFDSADTRISYLIETGLIPAIVGGWSWHLPSMGVDKMKKHWRYLVARYGAYPVSWIIGGEAEGPEWTSIAKYVRSIDPFHRLITLHPYPGSGRKNLSDDEVLDYDMVQTGHGGVFGDNSPYGAWQATAANTVSKVMSSHSKIPSMPIVVGEVTYEGHMMTNGPEIQRQMFWSSILSGSSGHTYGAGGIWQMNSDDERGAEYEFTPWYEAMQLPGSTQLGLAKKLLEEYDWWRFEPHPEWITPHSTTILESHEGWYDDAEEYQKRGGRWDLPYAAGIAGEVRIMYWPGHYYDWSTPTIKGIEKNIPYEAFLFNPSSGKKYDLGILINADSSSAIVHHRFANPSHLPLIIHENPNIVPAISFPKINILSGDEYKIPRLPAPQDWVFVMKKIKAID